MFKRSLITLIHLFLLALMSNAQGYDRDNYIKNMLPSSPSASALIRYIDYPLDYSTGVPSISYNLYTVEVDGVKVPITLSYHAGGIKVDDIGTAVGLGWSLQAGGGIFRQINGRADEDPSAGSFYNGIANSSYVNSLNVNIYDSAPPQQTLAEVASNLLDLTQDNYSYSFLDKSGIFYFNKNKVLTLADKCNLLIKDSISTYLGDNYHNFTSIDDNGNQYIFDRTSISSSTTHNSSSGDSHSGVGITDWMLTEIRTAGNRKINFSYTDYATLYAISLYDLFDVNTMMQVGNPSYPNPDCQTQPSTLSMFTQNLNHTNQLIQQIVSDNVRIQFFYSFAAASNWQTKLDSMEVFNATKLVKSIHFDYSVFNGDPRLKLTSFENVSLSDGSTEKYQFSYYDGGSRSLPPTTSKGKDMFGYYNGADYNTTLINSTNVYNVYHANRNIDTFTVLNGTLNEVILPTGGKIDFTFEANYLGSGQYFGGLRLKKRTVYDNVSNVTETESYHYDNAYGTRATNDLSIISEINNHLVYQRIYFNSNNYPIDQFRNTCFAKFGYLYRLVTEDKASATGETLRTVFSYDPFVFGRNLKGFLTHTQTYAQNGAQFTLNRDISQSYVQTTYDSLTTSKYTLGKGQIWTVFIPLDGQQIQCNNIYTGIDSAESFTQTIVQKVSESETLFTNSGQIVTKRDFYYDNPNHIYPTRTTLLNSDGALLMNKYKHPIEMVSDGLDPTGVYQDMVNRNMVAPTIVAEKYKDTSLLTSTTTQYRSDWYPNKSIIMPSYMDEVNYGKSRGKLLFLQYDTTGKLLQLAKENDMAHAYIYDYTNTYPIASVMNAAYSDVAATSFEADGKGNFAFPGSGVADSSAFTGSKVYPLSLGTITKSGLSSGTSYIVSYWSKTGSATVNGATASVMMSRRGWNYFQHVITGVPSVTISGAVTIDELRLFPQTSRMTTYTFDPLIGITSQTTESNRTSYYEYDGLQRLKRIRDQDYNIIKSIDYQYQGTSGCGSNCYILTMQTLAGTNTLGYPVGVFNVHGKLLGNAAGASQYVALWNNDTADSRIGTLATGGDSLHFNMTLNTDQSLPSAITGCRYYQVDLAWSNFDGLRNRNAAYVDFGDGTGIKLPANPTEIAATIPDRTTVSVIFSGEEWGNVPYYIHTYPDTTLKTLTFYHNDDTLNDHLDNVNGPATNLTRLKHFRGYLPQNLAIFGTSCYQQASMNTIDSIYNWNSLHNITYVHFLNGDQANPCKNMSYAQDFMQYNKGLQRISTTLGYYRNGYRDTTFKLSRLKSDWNTYFKGLKELDINDDHWSREDLSGLHQLKSFLLYATTQNHQDDPNSPLIPIPGPVIDSILNQIAAGAGQTVNNGTIGIFAGGSMRGPGSDAAVQFLLSRGWVIAINGVYLTNP